MELQDIKEKLPKEFYGVLEKEIKEFRPAQKKAIKAGLLEEKNLLVCTPTASGKTLIAELAFMKAILERKGKAVYIVPLKALASEKFKDFKKRYSSLIRIAMSIGDIDSSDPYLAEYDLIICTFFNICLSNVIRISKVGPLPISFNKWTSSTIMTFM